MTSEETADLWSFIKHRKATESASLKVLQQFVLSLNKYELRHLIEIYLKSKLPKLQNDKTVSYTKATLQRLQNNNNNINNNYSSIDTQILSKLTRKYGNKYNKKMLATIQQKHNSKKRTNLLSIHSQVLAYTFQYLSFTNLCKIQHTCLYFTYLNKTFPALTHYYFGFGHVTFLNIVKNKINFNFLSHFKHIDLEYIHYDTDARYSWVCIKKTKTKIFKHILKKLITQSVSTLHTLKINASQSDLNTETYEQMPPFNILLHIMNQFENLPITNLIWEKDIFKPTNNFDITQIITAIQSKLITSFPLLQNFNIGINNISVIGNSRIIPSDVSILTRYIIIPMINNYNNLHSLTLNCIKWNILHKQYKLISLISSQMKNLKKLSIISLVTFNIFDENRNIYELDAPPTIAVETLDLALKFENYHSVNCSNSCTNILTQLFSCFIGIKYFRFYPHEVGYSVRDCWEYRSFPQKISIDWTQIFNILLSKKSIYSTQNEIIFPLKSLKFEYMSYETSIDILNTLMNLRNEMYFDLEEFSIDTRIENEYEKRNMFPLFNSFVFDKFIPFMQTYNCNNLNLRTINVSFQLSCGNYNGFDIVNNYFEPVCKLLDNIPKCVNSFKLCIPPSKQYFGTESKKKCEIRKIECTKLAKKLIQILADMQEKETELSSIRLERIILPRKIKELLIFYFGYNDKLTIENDKYCFSLKG